LDRDVLAGIIKPEQIVTGFKRTKELRAQIDARLQSVDK
jgi:ribosomal protein L17